MIGYLENRLSFLDKLHSPSNKEVYTPLALVNEILDKIPDEVWGNITLKWLNPAVKNGVFLGAIILRLIKNYLEKGIFNTEQEAYDHIVQNQTYGYALSRGALRTANKLIYGSAKYKGNIIYGNILEEQIDMKFDVVIGNPPYQRDSSSAHKLWIDFLNKTLEITKSDAIIAFITPSLLWTGRTKKVVNLKNSIIDYVEYIDFNSDEYFNIGDKTCWYILNKNCSSDHINIFDKDKSTRAIKRKKDLAIETNKNDRIINSIINRVESSKKKLELVCDYENADGHATPKYLKEKNIIRDEKDDEYKIEFVHSGAQRFFTNNHHTYGDKLKVFINFSSSYTNMFYGYGVVGKQVEAILVNDEKEAKNVVNTLTKKLFTFYIKHEKNGGFNTGIYKLPALDFSKTWSDQELYDYFNLTQEEIGYIEANA